MSTTLDIARGANPATLQTGTKQPLLKGKKVLPDWKEANRANTESLKRLHNMDSQIGKLLKIIDRMTDEITQDALMDQLMPLQEMLDNQLNTKKMEANFAQTCFQASHREPPGQLGKDYIDTFVQTLNAAPESMTIDQFKQSMTANMITGEAHKKSKSKALTKADQNAIMMTKSEVKEQQESQNKDS
jgi:hypothetical protein